MFNNYGITAEQARFFKLGIDLDNNIPPFEKYWLCPTKRVLTSTPNNISELEYILYKESHISATTSYVAQSDITFSCFYYKRHCSLVS